MQEITKEGVAKRAKDDEELPLYQDTLAPFEYILFDTVATADFEKYKKFVYFYREHYFRHTNRAVSYEFLLLKSDDKLEMLAQEIVLYATAAPLELFAQEWQKKIDDFYKEFKHKEQSIAVARKEEKTLLQEYSIELSHLIYFVQKKSFALEKLLLQYTPLKLQKSEYALNSYFQNSYDLTDVNELQSYLENKKSVHVYEDILVIRTAIQELIINNNANAELQLKDVAQKSRGELLLEYATKEQNIIAHYKKLLSVYILHSQAKVDYLQAYAPFELYFDTYFADFDTVVQYYKLYYKGRDIHAVETPYYVKIYLTTKEKLTITAYNYEENLQDRRNKYIQNRYALLDITHLQREYILEVETLIEEFDKYAQMYIKELDNKSDDFIAHKRNIEQLKIKFLEGKVK